MFDPGEGAYFTFVNDIDDRYLAGLKPGGLTQTEADDGDNVQYDTLQNSSGAFIGISQIQGGSLASMKISAFELDTAYKGRNLLNNSGDTGGDPVTIDHVIVYDAGGNVLEDTDDLGNYDDPDIEVTFNGDGSVTVTSLDAGYRVEWETDGDHNQVLIEGVAGKFDVGFFGLTEGAVETASLADHAFVEDDGGTIGPVDDGYVQYVAGEDDTHSLNGDAGIDQDGTYEITDFTASFTYLGITVIGTLNTDKTEVHYFEDKDGSNDFSAGDVDYYTLALDPSGSGSYTFTVNNAPSAPPLVFDFDNLPSGSNLFGSVADSADGPGLFVFGMDPVLSNATTKYTNASDVIHTSQGGVGATIGVNNQMFDVGEGAYFTFVDDIRDNFLSGVSGGLTSTEADYGKNLLYDDGLHETDGAFLGISQIQAGSLASLKLTAFELDSDFQGTALIDNAGDPGDDPIVIDHVIVFDENGAKIEDTGDLINFDDASVEVIFNIDGSINVNNLDAGYTVAWETVADHNQVLVEATGGKFDVGFFGFNEAQAIPDQVLDFEVSLMDGDNDPVVDSFQVTVDALPYIV